MESVDDGPLYSACSDESCRISTLDSCCLERLLHNLNIRSSSWNAGNTTCQCLPGTCFFKQTIYYYLAILLVGTVAKNCRKNEELINIKSVSECFVSLLITVKCGPHDINSTVSAVLFWRRSCSCVCERSLLTKHWSCANEILDKVKMYQNLMKDTCHLTASLLEIVKRDRSLEGFASQLSLSSPL